MVALPGPAQRGTQDGPTGARLLVFLGERSQASALISSLLGTKLTSHALATPGFRSPTTTRKSAPTSVWLMLLGTSERVDDEVAGSLDHARSSSRATQLSRLPRAAGSRAIRRPRLVAGGE